MMYNFVCLFLFVIGLQPVTPGDGPHLPQVCSVVNGFYFDMFVID